MMDCDKLVKALLLCQFGECGCGKCYYKELKGDWCTEDNHPEFFDCDDKLKLDAAAAIEALQAEVKRLEPKRGEWTEIEDYDGDFHYQCSVCGEEWYFIDGTPADNNANYCPRCGAKMEVQE